MPPSLTEFGAENSAELGSRAGNDEPARTLKRPRMRWTSKLHKRFVDAVAHLGIQNAVPKTIMQLMGVDGLKRENIASHLRMYRSVKRMERRGGDDDNNGGGDDGDNNGGGGDDDNNGRGGGKNEKKDGGDGNGNGNNDKDEGSSSGSGNNGNLKRKQTNPMFGFKFGYHAGNENCCPVGQLQCVKSIDSPNNYKLSIEAQRELLLKLIEEKRFKTEKDDNNGGGGRDDNNNDGGGDDDNNDGGGKKEKKDCSNGNDNGNNDKGEGSGNDSSNNRNLKRKQMKPMFGCKFEYHAGNENWCSVGQLQCVKRVKYCIDNRNPYSIVQLMGLV